MIFLQVALVCFGVSPAGLSSGGIKKHKRICKPGSVIEGSYLSTPCVAAVLQPPVGVSAEQAPPVGVASDRVYRAGQSPAGR